MKQSLRVAIAGDYNPTFPPHQATDAAFRHASAALSLNLRTDWIPTPDLEKDPAILGDYDGVHVAPGSPYRSMEGGLNAVTWARQKLLPLLASCGGFQHVVIEYARRVLGIPDAQHAEYDPYASNLFISQLACSLVGQEMEVHLSPDSLTRRLYGSNVVSDQYYCNFGLRPAVEPSLSRGGLRVVGRDRDGEVRVLELDEHPFFIATLYVPGLTSSESHSHPLITGFLKECARD